MWVLPFDVATPNMHLYFAGQLAHLLHLLSEKAIEWLLQQCKTRAPVLATVTVVYYYETRVLQQ